MGSGASTDELSPANLLLLLAAVLFTLFAVLYPLLGFTLFGSDSGEYYRLTQILLANGHLPVGQSFTVGGYRGWGYAYPDFPGLFLLAGAGAQGMGLSVFDALTILVPVLTALAILPLFLLFRRIFPQDAIAILGAALATVAMPRLFSLAHPAPLALGDLFAVGGLWLFVEGRRDPRYYGPLGLVGAALIVTHHLSSYFFLLSAIGSLLFLELWRPTAWSLRFPLRELAFLGAFTSGMLLFWFDYASDFHGVITTGSIPSALANDPVPFIALAWAALVIAGLLIRFRRARAARPTAFRVRLPTVDRIVRDGVIIFAGIVGGISLLLFVPLPGSTQQITPIALLWFLPFFVVAAFLGGSRRTTTPSRIAPFGITWVAVLGFSAIFALATSNPVLLPGRHAEYMVIPIGILTATVIGYLLLRVEARYGRRGLVAAGTAVALLVGANAYIAYPPPAAFGGFQEGLSAQDATLWMWAGVALPPTTVVATDHPLSSMLFGFDGWYANWQFNSSTQNPFVGDNWSIVAAQLASMAVPHCPYRAPAQAVAIDATMTTGVALDPSAPALPLSPSAIAWFAKAPFVPIYENGGQAVLWIDGPIGSSVPPSHC